MTLLALLIVALAALLTVQGIRGRLGPEPVLAWRDRPPTAQEIVNSAVVDVAERRRQQRAELIGAAVAGANREIERVRPGLLCGERVWWPELAPLTEEERRWLLEMLRQESVVMGRRR